MLPHPSLALTGQVLPAQFLVPRLSYLHSVVPRALGFLQHVLPPGEHTPWFDYHRLPLKWCAHRARAGEEASLLALQPRSRCPLTLGVHL